MADKACTIAMPIVLVSTNNTRNYPTKMHSAFLIYFSPFWLRTTLRMISDQIESIFQKRSYRTPSCIYITRGFASTFGSHLPFCACKIGNKRPKPNEEPNILCRMVAGGDSAL